jgi:hypothetical protein
MYESSYPGQATESGDRENDPYVAIDVAAVAQKIGCSSELLFLDGFTIIWTINIDTRTMMDQSFRSFI